MKKRGSTHSSSEQRQRSIIDAALFCFTEKGITETNILEICKRSQSSIGSIYHHFGSKDGLARAVYLEGIREYQRGLVQEIEKHKKARDGIFGVICYHMEWVEKNPAWTRFLFQKRHEDFMTSTGDKFAQMNQEFARRIAGWFRKHVDAGTIKFLPPDLYPCILLGPCQEFLLHYRQGYTITALKTAAREFGHAAWNALSVEK
jgi:AcrR family transcriptional regulator